jgi:hypothetical protein
MKAFLTTGCNHFLLKNSIQRLCFYCNNIHLNEFEIDSYPNPEEIDLLFIFTEHEKIEKLYQVIYELRISPEKIRLIGYTDEYDINLLNFNNLIEQFKDCFSKKNIKYRTKYFLFNNQLKLFFSGHGGQSILSCITWINYYLKNYLKLSQIKDYNSDNLQQYFLLPGFESWKEFIKRFRKYAPIFWISGFSEEVESLENKIKIIENDLNRFEKDDSFYTFEIKSMQCLDEITFIIEDMAKHVGATYGKTKSTDS